MHEIVMARPSARKIVMSSTGIAHNISMENGEPTIALTTKKTIKVGINLKIAIITADKGNMILGKAVFKMSRCPAVIDFTPPVNELATK
jgi:hypothetical protein